MRCVIVGDAAYAEEYIARLKALGDADERVVFTGYVFGKGYQELGSNARIFVETSGVGGTHPALVEAMAFGNCVVANNTPENLETIGEAGFGYDGQQGADSLRAVLTDLLQKPDVIASHREKAKERAQTCYSWVAVTDAYERLFYQLCRQDLPERLRLPI
jgi:glycosyltransferase involved in cell wall biosynthesis